MGGGTSLTGPTDQVHSPPNSRGSSARVASARKWAAEGTQTSFRRFEQRLPIEGFPWRFPFQSRHRVLNTVSDRPKSAPGELNWPFRRKSRPPSNNWSRFGWRPRTWRTSRSTCPRQARALATFSRLRFRWRPYRGRGVAPSPLWRPDAGERRPARRIAGGEAFLQALVDLPIGRLCIRCRPPVPAARDRGVRGVRCAPL
jgi:hypothetical protein